MKEELLTNQPLPQHYLLCYNDACPMAETCLRRLAGMYGTSDDSILQVVNPLKNGGRKCKYYREQKTVRMAYGMLHLYDKVLATDIAALRKTIKKHFGQGSYYLRRNGKQGITPKEQDYISRIFSKYGYTDAPSFDAYQDEVLW